jgi:hypothetical protein
MSEKRKERIRQYIPREDDLKDGITFDKLGRMRYHPDFHPNHGKPYTTDELIYICKFYEVDGPRLISFAIGKTELTIMNTVCELRKSYRFEKYKNMSCEEWLKVAQ